LGCFLAVASLAQETQPPAGGTVIKGKAPVARELLKVRFPRPKSFTLANGLAVYVLEDRKWPAARFTLSIRAGTVFEPKAAVADLTASMLTEGTRSRDYRQIADATESIGASLSATAESQNVTLSVTGLSETADRLLELMADVLLNPAFPADRLERLKFQQTSQASQRRTNPQTLTANLSARVIYGGTPYGKPAPGPDEISAVTGEDLVAFHREFYRPNGAVLGVSGDVDASQLRSRLGELLAGWKAGLGTVASAGRRAETPAGHPDLPRRPTGFRADRSLVFKPGRATGRRGLHSAGGGQPDPGRRLQRTTVPEHPGTPGVHLRRLLDAECRSMARHLGPARVCGRP